MNVLQDVRYAFRGLRKSPGFAIIAVITLALGIGANTAIFTVVNAVFFHAVSVETPGRLVQIFTSDQRRLGIGIGTNLPVSYPNVEDIQRRAQSFSGVTIFAGAPVSMTINGQPDQYFAQLASANYFEVLGVQAAKGRTFLPQEGQLGAGPVIVISHGLWQRKFGGNPGVIGQNMLVNGQGFTIVGVAPEHFQGTVVIGGPDMWIPMSMHEQIFSGTFKEFFNERRFLGFGSVARLKDGATLQQAQAELQTIGSDLAGAFPLANKGRSFTPVPLLESSISPNGLSNFKFGGAMMMTVVGIVLLVACFNIANLLLARAAGRKREIAIRVALGASRGRIVIQLLTEAMVLATAGGLIGLGLARLGRDLIWRFRPPGLPETGLNLSLDWHVLLFTVVAAVGTGLIFGLAPALQSSRPNLTSELKERVGGDLRAGSIFKLRNLLVAAEVAICLIALVGAGFFIVSLRNAQVIDAGLDTRNLAMLSFNLGALNYDPVRAREFERRVMEAAQATPGVKAATLSNAVPLFNGGFGRTLFREGEDSSNGQNGQLTQFASVSPEYLQTMGIPMLRGRGFDGSIREDGPKVAIINETAARRIWPNQEAVGKRFKFFRDTEWTEVIGVVRDSKYNTLGEDPVAYTYLPLIQSPNPAVTLFLRTNGDPRPVLGSVRGQVQAMDHNLPLTNVWPIGEVFSQALWTASFSASLLSVFGAIAMILCAVGIYGVVGYTVRQRVREIGIRLALGAQPRDVLLMVVKQNAVVMAAGLMFGLAIAFALAYLLTSALAGLLYGVSTTSPITFAVTTLILGLVGLFASYIPARRAAKVDPLVALHYE